MGPLGVAEPAAGGPGRPAGGHADVGRTGDERHRRADGARAGPRPDRGPGAQRPGGHRRGHRRAGRPRPSSAPASLASSAPRAGTGRTGTPSSAPASPLSRPRSARGFCRRAGHRRVRGRRLRAAHLDGPLVPAIGVDPPPAPPPVRAMAAATSPCWPAAADGPARSRSARRRCARSTRGSARPSGSR